DLTCHSQKPAINSFDSVNGPSITVRLVPSKRTRLPLELACSPSPASMTPAFTNSSLNLPIAARISGPGRTPASDSLLAFTMTMTRIVVSPFGFGIVPHVGGSTWCRARGDEIDMGCIFFEGICNGRQGVELADAALRRGGINARNRDIR